MDQSSYCSAFPFNKKQNKNFSHSLRRAMFPRFFLNPTHRPSRSGDKRRKKTPSHKADHFQVGSSAEICSANFQSSTVKASRSALVPGNPSTRQGPSRPTYKCSHEACGFVVVAPIWWIPRMLSTSNVLVGDQQGVELINEPNLCACCLPPRKKGFRDLPSTTSPKGFRERQRRPLQKDPDAVVG